MAVKPAKRKDFTMADLLAQRELEQNLARREAEARPRRLATPIRLPGRCCGANARPASCARAWKPPTAVTVRVGL